MATLSGIITPTNVVAVAPGTSGNVLTSNGTAWTSATANTGAMELLASVTPTAAANVDFLNTFTSAYDNYLITFSTIQTATAGSTLNMQVAVGGTAQSGSNTYRISTTTLTGAFNSTHVNLVLGLGTLDATGNGFTGFVYVMNVNSTGWKSGTIFAQLNSGSDPVATQGVWVHSGSGTVSGVRFLLANNGANFAAQGQIRVYGLKNT